MKTKINFKSLLKRLSNSKPSSQRGLTLVEIIIVLIILSLLMTFLLNGLAKGAEGAKAKLNNLKMQKLKSSIGQYQLMYNQLPPDLQSLVSCPSGSGGCVPITDQDTIQDAWGTPFVYAAENGGRSFVIKSLGADGKEGGTEVNGDFTITGP